MTPEATSLERDSSPVVSLGLRERKKQQTRARLHRAALDLFSQQGFRATRIAEIAEAADVSESTFFRYFESKEGVALEGMRRRAQAIVEAVCARPAHESPIEACIAVSMSPDVAQIKPSADEAADIALLASTPELAPRGIAMGEQFLSRIAADVARRLGEPVGSLRVRTQTHALNAASNAAMEVWLADPTGVDLQAATRDALRELQHGL